MTSTTIDQTIMLDADNSTVRAVVNQIKANMRGGARYTAYVAEFKVTRDTVKEHALALARLVTPETAQKKDGKRTRFGNAVQAAGNGLRRALPESDDDTGKPVVLRVSLSGEGGATVTVPSDHEMYAALVEMVTGQTIEA